MYFNLGIKRRKRQSINAQPTWIKLYIFPTLEFTLLEKHLYLLTTSVNANYYR